MNDVDYGLILGSTNDEIWNEEVDKFAGTRALRKALHCNGAHGCPLNARQHVQSMFGDPDILEQAAVFLEPFEGEPKDKLLMLLRDDFHPEGLDDDDEDEDDIHIPFTSRPDGKGGFELVSHSGEVLPMADMPPPLRALLLSILGTGGDDDDTPPPGSHLH